MIHFELGNRDKASETASSITRSSDTDNFPILRTQHWAFGVMTWYKQLYFSLFFFFLKSNISSIAYIFRKSTHKVHFCSCLLCRLGYFQDCVQCAKLPWALELNKLSWSSLDLDSFFIPLSAHYEMATVSVRERQIGSVFNEDLQLSDMTCIEQVIFFIFYLVNLSSSF